MFKWFLKLFRSEQKSIRSKATAFEQRTITALHEAAHAVCTHHSSFHSLVQDITISSDTTGETFVGLSRQKASNKGKLASPKIVIDPDVVVDAAIIFFAGYEAEKVYCERNNIRTDFSHSINDYNQVDLLIRRATPTVTTSKEELISWSNQVVTQNWQTIELVANRLSTSSTGSLDAVSAIDLIQYGIII